MSIADGRYETINAKAIDAVNENDDDVAEDRPKELEKIAIRSSRRKTLVEIGLYLLPITLTFGILQLSFRSVYWRGTSNEFRRQ